MNRTARYQRAQVAARGPLEQSVAALVLDTLKAGLAVCGIASVFVLARIFGVIP